jgi:uncharacterized protein DUF4398
MQHAVMPASISRRPPLKAILSAVAALAAGCAINPAPNAQLAASARTIDLAIASEALERAPKELGSAQEKLGLAGRWIAARDHEPARWLAEQAQVDAELARMKAASLKAQDEAARAAEDLRALRQARGSALH